MSVTVQQVTPPLPSATGTGSIQVICDGSQRKYAVSTFGGPFKLGDAVATATLVAPSVTDTDVKDVRIVRP